jgi:hypothetical protein
VSEAGPDTRPTAFHLPRIKGVVCVARDYVIDVCGKPVRFEEGSYGGPALTSKRGEILKNQPGPRSPFWTAYETWGKQGRRVRDRNVCVYELDTTPKPRAVELWRGNYTQVAHDDPRTDEQVRADFLPKVKQ